MAKLDKTVKPLTNIELLELAEILGIKDFRGVFMRDTLPSKSKEREVGILNLDSSSGKGTHWVGYSKNEEKIYCHK